MARFIAGLLGAFFLAGCIKDPGAREWHTYEELEIPRWDPAILAALAEQAKWNQSDVRDYRRTELEWGQIALLKDMSTASRVPPDDLFETMRRHKRSFHCEIHALCIERDLAERYKMDQHELPCCDRALADIALRQAIIDVEQATPADIDGYLQGGYSFLEICEGYRATGKAAPPDKVEAVMDGLRRGEKFAPAPIGNPKPVEPKPSEQPAQPLPEQEPPKDAPK